MPVKSETLISDYNQIKNEQDMFESILEGVLNKYLGTYVEGLQDLNASIWSGKIELIDVMIKKDLFTTL